MCNHAGHQKRSSKVYDRLNSEVSILKKARRHSEETKAKMKKPKPDGFGAKISTALKGKTKTPQHCENQRIAQTGLIKHSMEHRAKVSSQMRGEGNIMFGKTHSKEAKDAMKRKAIGRGSGLKWYNNGLIAFRCLPKDADPAWNLGRKVHNLQKHP